MGGSLRCPVGGGPAAGPPAWPKPEAASQASTPTLARATGRAEAWLAAPGFLPRRRPFRRPKHAQGRNLTGRPYPRPCRCGPDGGRAGGLFGGFIQPETLTGRPYPCPEVRAMSSPPSPPSPRPPRSLIGGWTAMGGWRLRLEPTSPPPPSSHTRGRPAPCARAGNSHDRGPPPHLAWGGGGSCGSNPPPPARGGGVGFESSCGLMGREAAGAG